MPAAHLTCVGASAQRGGRGGAAVLGCGRPPHRSTAGRPAAGSRATARIPRAIAYAADLVAGLKRVAPISRFRWRPIPRLHPQALSRG